MSNSGFRSSSPSTSSSSTSSPSSGRGRGRGYTGVDCGPLKKPKSRSVNRTSSATGSPKNVDDDRDGSNSVPARSSSSSPNDPTTCDNLLTSQSSASSQSSTSDLPASTNATGQSMKASLDVGAAEFVPAKQRSHTLCPLAKEFKPSSQQPGYSADYYSLNVFIDNTLTNLLHNPSSYQCSIDNVISYFTSALQTAELMTTACDVIFNWALTENGMSYMCARLCEDISQHVPNNCNGRFHQHLLKRCRQEYGIIRDLLRNDVKRLCSFAVFLAELYTKDGFQINQVRDAIIEVLELMVENLDDELARPIGQILKMSGAKLEDDLAKTGETKCMESLLGKIGAKLANSGGTQLNRSMSELLKSVLTLRAANWGRTVSPQPSIPSSPATLVNYEQEPVFYSPGGECITREQAGYAEEDDATLYENGEIYEYSDGVVAGNYSDLPGASGDFTGTEDANGEPDLDLDILVLNDDDEEMTAEMWEEYERFEAERYQALRSMDEEGQ